MGIKLTLETNSTNRDLYHEIDKAISTILQVHEAADSSLEYVIETEVSNFPNHGLVGYGGRRSRLPSGRYGRFYPNDAEIPADGPKTDDE